MLLISGHFLRNSVTSRNQHDLCHDCKLAKVLSRTFKSPLQSLHTADIHLSLSNLHSDRCG